MGNSSFMELSDLTSNAAKQSDNFYNSLTSKGIVNLELELFYYPFRILHRYTMQ